MNNYGHVFYNYFFFSITFRKLVAFFLIIFRLTTRKAMIKKINIYLVIVLPIRAKYNN